MRFTVSRADLTRACGVVAEAVPNKSILPILANCRLTVRPASSDSGTPTLTIDATDQEIGASQSTPVDRESIAGSLLVPAQPLFNVLRVSRDTNLLFEERDGSLAISGPRTDFELPITPVDAWPEAQLPSSLGHHDIVPALLDRGICMSLFAAAKKAEKYVINGLLFDFEPDSLTLVGLDGRVCAIARIPATLAGEHRPPRFRSIISGKFARLLQKRARSCSSDLSISFVGNVCQVKGDGFHAWGRLLEGTFPDYTSLVPKHHVAAQTATVPAAELSETLRQVGVTLDPEQPMASFVFAQGSLTLETSGRGRARASLVIDYPGNPVDTLLNPHLLSDALALVGTDTVSMYLHAIERMLYLAHQSSDGKVSFCYMVAPLVRKNPEAAEA